MTSRSTSTSSTSSPVKVAVAGARGRMGSEAVAAVSAAADLELVAALGRGDALDAAAGADVFVDLTVPGSVMDNLQWALAHGLHVVTGTTGWTEERLAQLASWQAESRRPDGTPANVLVATNFGLGPVLIMVLAAKVAKFFESVEIVEMHHPDKVDAPSGSAIRTARIIAAARAEAGMAPGPDATTQELPGARGAVVDGVHVHAVRARGLTAHQEVVFGGPGEILTLRDDTFDRSAYMPGLLIGIRQVATRPGVTVGLENYLDLD